MPIEQFNKAVCRAFLQDVENALKPVLDKYGVELRKGGGRFSDGSFSPKIEFVIKGGQTMKERIVEQALAIYAPDLIGKKYRLHEKEIDVTIYGYDTKKRAYPILSISEDGRKFKTSEQAARAQVKEYDNLLEWESKNNKPKSHRVS